MQEEGKWSPNQSPRGHTWPSQQQHSLKASLMIAKTTELSLEDNGMKQCTLLSKSNGRTVILLPTSCALADLRTISPFSSASFPFHRSLPRSLEAPVSVLSSLQNVDLPLHSLS